MSVLPDFIKILAMKQNADIKAAVFDFDGTLYDKKGLSFRLFLKNLFHPLRLYRTHKLCVSLRGKDFKTEATFFDELFTQLASRTGLTKKQAEKWYEEKYLAGMIRILEKSYRARKSVPELLRTIREKNIKLILYSDYGECEKRVSAVGLNPEDFDSLYSSSMFGGLKPGAAAFERMLRKENLSPQDVIFAGDSDACDRTCAEKAGALFYSVKTDEDIGELLRFFSGLK